MLPRLHASIRTTAAKRLRSFAAKPFAMLAASFEVVILVDANALFFAPPERLLGLPSFATRGVQLFNDYVRAYQIVDPWLLSGYLGTGQADVDAYVRITRGAECDSSVVVVDKARAWRYLHVVAALNWWKALVDRHTWGDKDTWALAAVVLSPGGGGDAYASTQGSLVGWLTKRAAMSASHVPPTPLWGHVQFEAARVANGSGMMYLNWQPHYAAGFVDIMGDDVPKLACCVMFDDHAAGPHDEHPLWPTTSAAATAAHRSPLERTFGDAREAFNLLEAQRPVKPHWLGQACARSKRLLVAHVMYALSIELPSAEAFLEQQPIPEPIIHVDFGVQTEEWQLPPPALPTFVSGSEESELAALPTAPSGKGPTPDPRQSGGASPWLVGDDYVDDDDDADEGDDATPGALVGGKAAAPSSEPSVQLELTQIGFVAGHPSGELQVGSIGFYKYEHPPGVVGLSPPPLRSNTVCIPAVPSWLSSYDLIRFLGGYARMVRHMRLLRDSSMPHRHMLLLQFGSHSIAERFRANYHAKRFNSLEPEVALVVHVAQVVFAPPQPPSPLRVACPHVHLRLHVRPSKPPAGTSTGGLGEGSSMCLPCEDAGEDPSERPAVRVQLWARTAADTKRTLQAAASEAPPPLAPPSAEALSALEHARRGMRASLPPLPLGSLMSSAIELPSCPVCLERLDPSVTGVVTIVCDHTFHCECLRRWADSSCPVCRHVSDDDSAGRTSCEVCGTLESLWICLVCGHVGCGRYTGCGSGVHHNEKTGHNFAMELSTQRVWDYEGDNYVHRLIQNKVDGKLVELPDPRQAAGSSAADGVADGAADAARELKQRGQEEQYEAVVHEYSLLLTGQLEVQRRHYDERLLELDRAHKRHMHELDQELAQREAALQRQVERVERESRASVKRVQSADKVVTERDFNKSLNEQLMRNQEALRQRLLDAEQREAEQAAKAREMAEQLRDMTFHFESQIKILQGGAEGGLEAELAGGEVSAPTPPPSARSKRKAKARGSG